MAPYIDLSAYGSTSKWLKLRTLVVHLAPYSSVKIRTNTYHYVLETESVNPD